MPKDKNLIVKVETIAGSSSKPPPTRLGGIGGGVIFGSGGHGGGAYPTVTGPPGPMGPMGLPGRDGKDAEPYAGPDFKVLSTKRPPKCFIVYEDENITYEVMLQEVRQHARVGELQQIDISGFLDPVKSMEAANFRKVIAGDGLETGGIPPTVVLRCPRCDHLTADHECKEADAPGDG